MRAGICTVILLNLCLAGSAEAEAYLPARELISAGLDVYEREILSVTKHCSIRQGQRVRNRARAHNGRHIHILL